MNRGPFAKVYRALWDGTLGTEGDAWPMLVFLLAHSNADGIVNLAPSSIAGRCGWPLERVLAGLRKLESDDPDSRTEAEDGRRIVRLEEHRSWGWRIVNYPQYREMTPAERQAQKRFRDKSHGGSRGRHEVEGEVEGDDTLPFPHPVEAGRARRRALPASDSPLTTDPTIAIPLCTGEEFVPTEADLNEWRRLYPGLDIIAKLREIRGYWGSRDRSERKGRGIRVSINRWLAIEQDRGGGRPDASSRRGHRAGADARWKAANVGGSNG